MEKTMQKEITKEKRRKNYKKIAYIIFSLLIGLLLILPEDITWAQDRINYLRYAEHSWQILELRFSQGILPGLSNEPVFLLINSFFNLFFTPEVVLKTIIFLSTILVLYSLGKISKYNLLVLIFFLFVPQILKNHTMTLRHGLALGFYLVGLTSESKYKNIMKVLSVFIHTSFIVLIFFEILEKLFKKTKFAFATRIIVSTLFITVFLLAIPTVADFLGDRRAAALEYGLAESSSGLGWILWLVVGTAFILFVENSYLKSFCSYGIVFYLTSYFTLSIGARIFEGIIPIIMAVAISDKRKEVRVIFILFFIVYGILLRNGSGGFLELMNALM